MRVRPVSTSGYVRYGAIRPAFFAMRRGKLELARKHLQSIRFPTLLSAESKAYYHWIQGVLAAEDASQLEWAEDELQRAISGKLRTSNDRCLALATLAQIVASRGGTTRAGQILTQAQQTPHRAATARLLEELSATLHAARDCPVAADPAKKEDGPCGPSS